MVKNVFAFIGLWVVVASTQKLIAKVRKEMVRSMVSSEKSE